MKFLFRLTSVARVAAVLSSLVAAVSGRADERFFGYVYETDLLPKGRWEAEQHITFRKGYPEGDRRLSYDVWDFREELEYGVTDRLSIAGYLNFRSEDFAARVPGVTSSSEFSFKGVSTEIKYQILNPNTHPIGLVIYFEPTYSAHEVELEEKLILSKMINDQWVLAGNLTLEQEWEREGGVTEKESVFEVTVGAAYRLTPHWSVGLEGRFHSVYEGHSFDEHLGTGWFVGPNVHYGSARWWGTLSVLPQVAGNPSDGGVNLTEHQKFEVRLLLGLSF